MDLIKLKRLLENTQASFPPHYPTKTHGVTDQIPRLINNLKNVIDYIGFSNANIAIKNIIGKMINEFLISTRDGLKSCNCDFEITTQEMSDGKRVTISYGKKSLVLEYLNDGITKVINQSECQFVRYGEDYSNASISYNINEPNDLLLKQMFANGSTCKSYMTFSTEGIEQKRFFEIVPRTRYFEAANQCVKGSIERKDDFYTACLSLEVEGNDFGGIISNGEINAVKSMPEIVVPVMYIGSLKYDFNFLNIVTHEDRENGRSGAIQELIYKYISSVGLRDKLEEYYDRSKKVIEYSDFLEFPYDSLDILLPMIHAPYSFEILKNIKEYVRKQESVSIMN